MDIAQTSLADLKRAFGSFPTGVTVMTTLDPAGAPVGMTASSFNTVSLSPPLVLWSIRCDSHKRAAFSRNDRFVVNILAEGQTEACYGFARPQDAAFETVGWTPGQGGLPLLDEAAAHLECRVWSRHLAGDHEIVIGEITALSVKEVPPMVFHAGRLRQLQSQPVVES